MNDLERLEKKYVEMGNEIERLKNKVFDFREWYKGGDVTTGMEYRVDSKNDYLLSCTHRPVFYETQAEAQQAENRRVAEYIIRKHFEQIVGDWVPDWEESSPATLFWGHRSKDIQSESRGVRQFNPNWLYFPANKADEILAEVERMKIIYGKDIVTMYLTDTYE